MMSGHAPDAADEFLSEIVRPTVADFGRDQSDLRHAVLAAITVSSLADYIFEARPALRGASQNVGKFRQALAKANADYGRVRDIGDATKHFRIDRPNAEIKQALPLLPPVEYFLTEDGSRLLTEDGHRLIVSKAVVVTFINGTRHEVMALIRGGIAYLEDIMSGRCSPPP
jgi:hypothetical protein